MAASTVLQLINAAAEEIEVVASGDSLTTPETASALDRLNRLIDASSADRALIYTERMDTVSLVGNQQSYTIGKDPAGILTANFNIARPVRITRANLLLDATVRRPVNVIGDEEWAAIRYQTVYGPPHLMYNDGAFVNGFSKLFFYLIPDKAYSLELYSWQANAKVTATTDAIDYPPGYADYWMYALAARLCPMFGRAVSEDLRENLRMARERIGALNCESPALATESALLGPGAGGLYNWKTGQLESY